MATTSGSAIFFDGVTSTRHTVRLELDDGALLVRSAAGAVLARWPFDNLAQLSWDDGVLRLGYGRGTNLARVEVRDPELARAIDEVSLPVDRTERAQRRSRRKVVLWSCAAVLSLLFAAVFGIPELASRVAPIVPYSLERKLGEAVDEQVREMLGAGSASNKDAFECGAAESERAGREILEALVARLAAVAELPVPLKLSVVRRPETNAVALPGGRIYVFEKLIGEARSPDELAGVIAHEIGHVAHRDGTRSVLQTAGLSLLFGLVLGDFVGGGAVVLAAKTVLKLAYSREVETAADLYSVALMEQAGGDPRALGVFLQRVAGVSEPGMKILLNHPEAKARADIINARSADKPRTPLLSSDDWATLKRICRGS